MQTVFRGRHFINLEDFTKEEIETMLDVSVELKRKFAMGIDTPYLLRKTIFLMFFEQSTRTRNSMEAGIAQLGGHANYLDTSTMQISHGESAKDTAVILSRFGHGIACRNCFWEEGNKYLMEMAKHSSTPIMNLQCDLYHPMHALPADRKNEVEDSVIDGTHSVIYDEAENRLHTAKAVMTLVMGGK